MAETVNSEEAENIEEGERDLKGKKLSWGNLRGFDSFHFEAAIPAGGTFALYSLISRHVKISLIPNQQAEDAMVSNYRLETPSRKLKRAQWIKQKLESSKVLQIGLFLITILATSMIIGDGVLTPAISGIAVVSVMLITTALVTLVMLLIWKTSIWWISLFVIVIGGIEAIYLSAVLSKFIKGGYLPLALAFFLMLVMGTWHYVHAKRYNFELENKVSSNYIQELAADKNITRIPGIGLLYSELVQGIPPIFRHFVEKIPSIHSIFIFVSVKHLPVSKVEPRERFLFRQFEPRDLRMFKCVVRYGYKDAVEAGKDFEKTLIEHLKEFIHHEFFIREGGSSSLQNHPSEESAIEGSATIQVDETLKSQGSATIHVDETLKYRGSANHSSGSIHPAANSSGGRVGTPIPAIEEEKQFIQREMEKGVVYLLGETEMVAKPDSSIIKRVVVNNIYRFIRLNFRQGDEAMAIPKARLAEMAEAVNSEEAEKVEEGERDLKGKKLSWGKLRGFDSFHFEAVIPAGGTFALYSLISRHVKISLIPNQQAEDAMASNFHPAGITVVSVMLITTALVTLVMLLIWKTSIWWISLFVVVIGGIEAIYLSAVLSNS